MNVLELHAGSRSIGQVAEKLGMTVFSVDWTNYHGIDLVIDIEHITMQDIPFVPDIIWSSPDCTTYSIAACGHHRNEDYTPKTEYAKKCDKVNQHFIKLIKYYQSVNPGLKFFIENPRGVMRKMRFMEEFERATVWYCRYGDKRAKPTDIFTNHLYSLFNQNGWIPRAECWNGRKNCHEEAPRGARTGTQGIKTKYEKSFIPPLLCQEILKSTLFKLKN